MSRRAIARLSYGIDIPTVYSPQWATDPKWLEADDPAEEANTLLKAFLPYSDAAVIWDVSKFRLVVYEEEVADGVLNVGSLPVRDADNDKLHTAAMALGLNLTETEPGWTLSARPIW